MHFSAQMQANRFIFSCTVFAWPLRYLLMETYLIVYPPHNLLESRRSYFTKPYFCDVPRNIQFPLKSDHDIAGPHRIIYNYDRLLDNWTKKYTFYLVGKLLHFFVRSYFFISSFLLLNIIYYSVRSTVTLFFSILTLHVFIRMLFNQWFFSVI